MHDQRFDEVARSLEQPKPQHGGYRWGRRSDLDELSTIRVQLSDEDRVRLNAIVLHERTLQEGAAKATQASVLSRLIVKEHRALQKAKRAFDAAATATS